MNVPTGRMNLTVSAADIMRQRLQSRMYDNRNTRGPFFYGNSPSVPSVRSMSGLRGLGSTDVSDLAYAIATHQIHPQFISGMKWYPAYLPPGTADYLPENLFLDDATSQQIAGLLGGSVVKGVPDRAQPTMGNEVWQNAPGSPLPMANFIQLPDGTTVNAAALASVAGLSISVPNMSVLCGTEYILSNTIPGGVMGSDCGGNPNAGYDPSTGYNVVNPPAGAVVNPPTTTYNPPPPPPATSSPSMEFKNTTTGQAGNSLSFHVGDSFRILIVGAAPNSPVTVTATQNGVTSTTVLGNTSVGGSFETSGVMDASTQGSWMEKWQIPAGPGASALASQVNFSVYGPSSGTDNSNPLLGQEELGSSGGTQGTSSGGDNTILYVALAAVAAIAIMGRR